MTNLSAVFTKHNLNYILHKIKSYCDCCCIVWRLIWKRHLYDLSTISCSACKQKKLGKIRNRNNAYRLECSLVAKWFYFIFTASTLLLQGNFKFSYRLGCIHDASSKRLLWPNILVYSSQRRAPSSHNSDWKFDRNQILV